MRQVSSRSGLLPAGTPAVQWAVCAPSSCGAEGVAEVATFNLAQLGVAVTADVVTASCFANGDPEFALDGASWGAM